MKNFRDLGVLHAAHDLVVEIHDFSQAFPDDDGFGATRAITRSVLAIPRSIAHGCGRDGAQNLSDALENAAGDLGLIDEETLEELAVSLNAFKKQLEDDLADL